MIRWVGSFGIILMIFSGVFSAGVFAREDISYDESVADISYDESVIGISNNENIADISYDESIVSISQNESFANISQNESFGGGNNSASYTGNLEKTLDYFGTSGLDKEVSGIEAFKGQSFSEIVTGVINGSVTLTFSELMKIAAERFFGELYESLGLMRDIVVIAILGAVLKSLSASFGESSVTEIGFYVIYIAVVSLLIASFAKASGVAADVIGGAVRFMQALLPVMIALLAASGRYAISFVFHPLAVGVIQIASLIINAVVMKLIVFTASLHMVSYLLPENSFEQMAELARGIIGKGLKWLAVLFMSFVTLKTAVAPIAGGAIGKGAKLAVSSVPVVGQVFAGAVDSAYYWSNSVKNGVAATGIVIVAVICAAPVIKLCALAFVYKLTAAVIQPVADERIVECMDAAGDYVLLFAVAVMSVAVMMVVLLMMVIAAGMG